MGFPVTGGYPNYDSSHTSKYTPKLYAQTLLYKFYAKTVFGEIATRDYEGQIKGLGDTVIIRTRPDITVSDYTRNLDLNSVRQFPEPAAVELAIDKAKFYSVSLDAIDEAQFDIDALSQWATDGSEALGIAIDTNLLANIYTQANASNVGLTAGVASGSYNMGVSGTPLVLTKGNILDFIADAAAVLSEQNVPEDADRWLVLPTILANRIQKSDLRSALFSGDQSNRALRNGRIGEIAGFKIYASNNLTAITGSGSTSVWPCIFGHKGAVTFASQLVKERIIDLQNTFGRALDALHVYGYKVVNPKYIGYGAAQAG